MPSKATTDQAALKEANRLLAMLPLEEKIKLTHGASTMSVAQIKTIGMPAEFTMSDGPHNVRQDLQRGNFSEHPRTDDQSTYFPALSALGATWDRNLAAKFGTALGREARARQKDMMLGPSVNMARTPLSGRNWECIGGEDPFLASEMVVPVIRSMQAQNIASTVKHYAVNNQERQRTTVDATPDERTLREIYLPAFEAAIKKAGSLAIMNAYNRFRGEHCSHSDYLNNKILKGEWGFPGLVVTDWGSLHDEVKGALGGTDIEMKGGNNGYYERNLLKAVKDGKVPESVVDNMARRVIYVMVKIGKFQDNQRAPGAINTPEHQAVARKIAEDSIVLLKNNGVLPLSKQKVKKLLVLGEHAIMEHYKGGFSAEGYPLYEKTPLQGLQDLLGDNTEIKYAPLQLPGEVQPPIEHKHLTSINKSATIVGAEAKGWKVEYFNDGKKAELGGIKPSYTSYVPAPKYEEKSDWNKLPKGTIEKDNYMIRWTGTVIAPVSGAYIVSIKHDDGGIVYFDDQPLITNMNSGTESKVIILEKGKEYEIKIEMYERAGEASLEFGWKLPDGNYISPANLEKTAKTSDAVIIISGTSHFGDARTRESEMGDRNSILPPASHMVQIPRYLKMNPNTVVVNMSGNPVHYPWVKNMPAFIQFWYAGQEGGTALANVLFGDVNPSGKLPFTVPYRLKDSPAHHIKGNWDGDTAPHIEGLYIGYRWFQKKKITPQFAFGHGLSYTTFDIGPPTVSKPSITKNQIVTVTVPVTNTGNVAGAEVVQLYVEDVKASVDRPKLELKGFEKVFLKPAESKNVNITLVPRDFSFWDIKKNDWKAEAGEFIIHVGSASDKIENSLSITLD
jgi:beta-glucosidase